MIGYLRNLLPVRREEARLVLRYALLAPMVLAYWSGKVGPNGVFGRIAENLTSADLELRRNASQVRHGEGRAVPTGRLAAALAGSGEDGQVGMRPGLTRRGALAMATEANIE